MYRKFRNRNSTIGKKKLLSEPRSIAKPNEKIIPPRYIGFRLYRKTPFVIKTVAFLKKLSVVLFSLKLLLA